MRFGIGLGREYTLSEVAAKLGVSLERVRQIQLRAMDKLKTDDLERVADPYLN
jgi:DNA-directed RNA polymerase sigma subunit (sigma70/sigma32)